MQIKCMRACTYTTLDRQHACCWVAIESARAPMHAQSKANVNQVDFGNGEQTPLHVACVNGRQECARLLIEANADPSATTSVRACIACQTLLPTCTCCIAQTPHTYTACHAPRHSAQRSADAVGVVATSLRLRPQSHSYSPHA